ncbi:hypothetical protein MtrunA17_Chr1g0193471 [Medicago truncatula]|uniref:Transmembrane protein n=1 Tax=Medicago truncatula TaxID=3880 RepID=G7IAF0_MEDTR|nr:hypothetical protein MTR_1g085230 [Medicago truncatula]RHN80921.1 hypothetical protein MtrunA17_Chr1g0193471 [Medicago truncatula]
MYLFLLYYFFLIPTSRASTLLLPSRLLFLLPLLSDPNHPRLKASVPPIPGRNPAVTTVCGRNPPSQLSFTCPMLETDPKEKPIQIP